MDDLTNNMHCIPTCCNPIQIECDLTTAICQPVILERIYDCITMENNQAIYEAFKFLVPEGASGEVEIVSFNLDYDFIGARSPIQGRINSEPAEFTGIESSKIQIQVPNDNLVDIYDEFSYTARNYNCYCQESPNEGIQLRVNEKDINFVIKNLKIVINVRIGCEVYKVCLPLLDGTPITYLGFNKIDFNGRICIPKYTKRIFLYEELVTCLNIECVGPCTKFIQSGDETFELVLDLTLSAKKVLHSIVKEKTTVFISQPQTACMPTPFDQPICNKCNNQSNKFL